MFIIQLTFTQPLAEIVAKYGDDHGHYLDRYYQSGHFIVSGPQNPKVGGLIVAKAKDYAEAKAITEEDPFVINNVVDYQITEFNPNKQQEWFKANI